MILHIIFCAPQSNNSSLILPLYRTLNNERIFWNRIKFFPDGIETVPENFFEDIYDEINPPERIYKSLEDYTEEELKMYPDLGGIKSDSNFN